MPAGAFANLNRVMSRVPRHSIYLFCVLVALVMRAAIPAGYMPATAGSGLLFELCPSAVPAEILAAMSGSRHMHHHDGEGSSSHFNAERCPIGQVLSMAAAIDIAAPVEDIPAVVAPAIDVSPAPGARSPVNRRSRSPPA